MKQFVGKLLVFCDYLRQPYEFKLKYDQRNGTPLGGILSLIFGTILVFYFASSYIQVIISYKFTRQLEQQGNKLQDGDRKFISNTDILSDKDIYFSLRFRTQDAKGEVKDTYLSNKYTHYTLDELQSFIQIEAFTVVENEGLSVKKINISDCNDTSVYLNSESWLQKPLDAKDFPKLICAFGKYNLSGYEDTENTSYLRIILRKCNNIKCSNQIDDFLERLQVSIVFVSNSLNLNLDTGEFVRANYTTIVSQRIFEQPIELSCYIAIQKMGIKQKSVRQLLVGGDNFEEIARGTQLISWQKQFLARDYILESLGEGIENNLLQINIRINSEILSQFAERADMLIKIFDALSLFGGLFTTFFTFLSLIYKFYQRHQIYQHLMNQNLIFDLGKLETKRLKPRKTTNFLLKNFTYQVSFSYPSYLYLKFKQFLIKLLRIKLLDEKDLIVFQEAQTLLKRELDLTHILEKLLEVDKLKLLLMDDQQLCLFNSLAKPTIQIEGSNLNSERRKSLNLQRSSIDFSKIISFNQGFFRSEKIINDGPKILEKFFQIMDGSNPYNDVNQRFLELLKMNKKLYRILEVQYKLSRVLQRKWKDPNDTSKKTLFKRCVCKIISQLKNGTLDYCLSSLQKQVISTNHQECDEFDEQNGHQRIPFNIPNIQSVILTRKKKLIQKLTQSRRSYILQKRNSIGDE